MRMVQSVIFCLLFLITLSVHAKSYKCTDSEGNIEYSQFPCPHDQDSKEIHVGGGGSKEQQVTCKAVQSFTVDIVKRMRGGTPVEEEVAQHGGLSGISKATLNIINYVYSFKANEDVSETKIGALARARCQNNAYGNVEYADLPEEYDPESVAKQKPAAADEDNKADPKSDQTVQQPEPGGSNMSEDCQKLMAEVMSLGNGDKDSSKSQESDEMLKNRSKLIQRALSGCAPSKK